jgi:hypothetical protein
MDHFYRCILLGRTGEVDAIEEIAESSNYGALEQARTMFRHRPQHTAFELWWGGTRIHCETRTQEHIACPSGRKRGGNISCKETSKISHRNRATARMALR